MTVRLRTALWPAESTGSSRCVEKVRNGQGSLPGLCLKFTRVQDMLQGPEFFNMGGVNYSGNFSGSEFGAKSNGNLWNFKGIPGGPLKVFKFPDEDILVKLSARKSFGKSMEFS